MLRASSREYSAMDRRQTLLDAIDGLQAIQRVDDLTRVQLAALDALERLYMRTVNHTGALISLDAVAWPLSVAREALTEHQRVKLPGGTPPTPDIRGWPADWSRRAS